MKTQVIRLDESVDEMFSQESYLCSALVRSHSGTFYGYVMDVRSPIHGPSILILIPAAQMKNLRNTTGAAFQGVPTT